MRDFGCWITQENWHAVYDATLVQDKYDAFSRIFSNAIDLYLSFRKARFCSTDKPWVTPKLKQLVAKRPSTLSLLGKDYDLYKRCRNSVQNEYLHAKQLYYKNKFASLKSANIR